MTKLLDNLVDPVSSICSGEDIYLAATRIRETLGHSNPSSISAQHAGTTLDFEIAIFGADRNAARTIRNLPRMSLTDDEKYITLLKCAASTEGAILMLRRPQLLPELTKEQLDELGRLAMQHAPKFVKGSRLLDRLSKDVVVDVLKNNVLPGLLHTEPSYLINNPGILWLADSSTRIEYLLSLLKKSPYEVFPSLSKVGIHSFSVPETKALFPEFAEANPRGAIYYQQKFSFEDEQSKYAAMNPILKRPETGLAFTSSPYLSPEEKLELLRSRLTQNPAIIGQTLAAKDVKEFVPNSEFQFYSDLLSRSHSQHNHRIWKRASAEDLVFNRLPSEVIAVGRAILTYFPEASTGEDSQDPHIKFLVKDMPWGSAYKALEGIQARTGRIEFDPWVRELAPLVRYVIDENLLDPNSKADGQIIVDFVSGIGMRYARHLIATYVELRKSNTWDEVSQEVRAIVCESKGLNSNNSPSQAAVALLKLGGDLQKAILNERNGSKGTQKLVELLDNPVFQDLFFSIKGSTQWEGYYNLDDITKTCLRTVDKKRKPETRIRHRETTLMVKMRSQVSTEDASIVEEKLKQQVSKTHVQNAWHDFKDAVTHRVTEHEVVPYLGTVKVALISELETKHLSMLGKLEHVKKEAVPSLRLAVDQLRDLIIRISEPSFLSFTNRDMEDGQCILVKAIEEIAKAVPFRCAARDTALLRLSFSHMYPKVGEEMQWKLDQLIHSVPSPEILENCSEFLLGYVNTHYLARGSTESQRDSGLSNDACEIIRRLWQLEKPLEQPLVKTHSILFSLQENHSQDLNDNRHMPVHLVPLGLFGRVWAGDFGDACYTKYRVELAQGKFSNITSYAIVTGRHTQQERIYGSVLVIETTTPEGDNVLLVRANNPRKNLLARVDPDSLVSETLKHFVQLAFESPAKFRYVCVPLDNAGDSGSNREEVSSFYYREYSNQTRLELSDQPATNFNGYDNWNSAGLYPSVVVSERAPISDVKHKQREVPTSGQWLRDELHRALAKLSERK